MRNIAILVVLLTVLASCHKSKIDYDYPEDPELLKYTKNAAHDSIVIQISNDDNTVLNPRESKIRPKDQAISKELSRKLFNIALHEVSNYPINTADSNANFISTDWLTTKDKKTGKKTRVKLNVSMSGYMPNLGYLPGNLIGGMSNNNKDIVKVTAFKQEQQKDDKWTTAVIDDKISSEIERKIMLKTSVLF